MKGVLKIMFTATCKTIACLAALAALERLVADHPGTRVRIEQPPMTDVFRRVLAERAASGGEP